MAKITYQLNTWWLTWGRPPPFLTRPSQNGYLGNVGCLATGPKILGV